MDPKSDRREDVIPNGILDKLYAYRLILPQSPVPGKGTAITPPRQIYFSTSPPTPVDK